MRLVRHFIGELSFLVSPNGTDCLALWFLRTSIFGSALRLLAALAFLSHSISSSSHQRSLSAVVAPCSSAEAPGRNRSAADLLLRPVQVRIDESQSGFEVPEFAFTLQLYATFRSRPAYVSRHPFQHQRPASSLFKSSRKEPLTMFIT